MSGFILSDAKPRSWACCCARSSGNSDDRLRALKGSVTKDGWIREADEIQMARDWKQKLLPRTEWPERSDVWYWLRVSEFVAEVWS